MPKSHPLVLAITGASGAAYGVRLLDVLLATEHDVHLTVSPSGAEVIRYELGREVDVDEFRLEPLLPHWADMPGSVTYHHYRDFFTPIASGSFLTSGMVICPCSGGTLGQIVHASGDNLIHHAAEVHLKERRPLIVVPRETPLSVLQLENMHRAAQAGITVLPASPGFYHGVQQVSDLVDFVVARILDQLHIEHHLTSRWGGK